MGCNCGKRNKGLIYIYTDTKGHEKVFTSQAQAKAAQIRAGGGGSIRSKPAR